MTFDKSANYYMAIDFGTNHVSVSIGAPTGVPLATIKQPVAFSRPENGPGTALEFDPAAALKLVIATANAAIGESNISPSDISGIGVTSQRRGLVLLNLEGSAIHAVSNRDMRATKEGAEIDANALVDLWELTGHGPGRLTAWAHLKWILDNDSETYDRTRTMCSIADWLALELTGELLMEETLAVESGLGLVATGDPARALSPAFNLGDIQLPATCAPGTVVGQLKKSFTKTLGLPANTPVVACGPDTQTGLLGLGAQLPNAVGILSGWSTHCQRITERPVFDDTRSMWTGRHVISNRWIIEGGAGDTGGTYQWLLSLLYGSLNNAEVMNSIDEPLGNIEPGSNAVTSFLGPSFVNATNNKVRSGGIMFPVPISFEPPDRFDIARSALDNFAFAIRYTIERLNSFRGPALNIAVSGGMTKTESFRSILADVLGCEIGIDGTGESTSLGTLSQVAASVGNGPSIAEYAAIRATELTTYEPDDTRSNIYENLYTEWRHKERLLDSYEV
jgi:sugar (pentulose or hexulose) kinase